MHAVVWDKVRQTIRAAAASRICRQRPHPGAVRLLVGRGSRPGVGASAKSSALRCSTLTPAAMNICPGCALRSRAERLYAINGNTLGSPYSLTKLKWIKQYQPDLYAADRLFHALERFCFLSCSARSPRRLQPGQPHPAVRSAKVRTGRPSCWPGPVWTARNCRRRFPPARSSARWRVRSPRSWGFPRESPSSAAGTTSAATPSAAGSSSRGSAMYGMGTYLCAVPVFSRRPDAAVMIARGLNTEHHAVPGPSGQLHLQPGRDFGQVVPRYLCPRRARADARLPGRIFIRPCWPKCRTPPPG